MTSSEAVWPAPTLRLRSPSGRWLILATALGSGLIFLDSTVVNVALPRIQSDFAASLAGLQWIVNAYTLMLAALLFVGGSAGDLYGLKRVFTIGLAVFTVASIACGLAPSIGALIVARMAQGAGGALLVPGSLAIIQTYLAPEDRPQGIGLWAGFSGVFPAAGPLLGGYLVDVASWRVVFLINAPLALLTVYALRRVPGRYRRDAHGSLDWIGVSLVAIGLGALTYGLIDGPVAGWDDPLVLVTLVIGTLSLLAFPVWEARAPSPMLPPGTFRSRNFSGANLATIGVYFSLYGVIFFLVLNLQQVQGYTAFEAGLALLPMSLLLLVLSPRVGALTSRFGARLLMVLGPIVVGAGFALLALAGNHAAYMTGFFPGLVLIGLGMSIFVTPLTTTVMSSVPPRLVGVASGTSNTLTRVAALLAVAILGVILLSWFDTSLQHALSHRHLPIAAQRALLLHRDRLAGDPIPPGLSARQAQQVRGDISDAFLAGFRWAMLVCAGLCLVSAAIAWLTIEDTSGRAATGSSP